MSSSPPSSESAIKALFTTYQQILNTSSLASILNFYTDDATCLFPKEAPHIGLPAVLSAYESLFNKVDHIVNIVVEDITVVDDGKWAFVRTKCVGACRVRETGEEIRDLVWQLWVVKRVDAGEGEEWKVHRYAFSHIL